MAVSEGSERVRGGPVATEPADLLSEARRVLHVDGLLARSRELYLAAHEAARSGADAEAAAEAALGLGGLWVHEQRTTAEAMATESRQRRALAMLPDGAPLALRLRTRLAAEADYRDGGATRILAALRATQRSGDPVARAEALSLAHHCFLGPGRERTRLALADALLRTACETGRRVDLLGGLLWRAVDLHLAGHWYADRALAEVRQALGETPHAAFGFVLSAIDVMRATRAGRLEEAQRLATACAEDGERVGDADALGWHAAQRIAVAWFAGRLVGLRPELEDVVGSPRLGAVSLGHEAALAVARAEDGDLLEAASLVARLRDELRRPARSSSWLATAYGTVEAAHLLGDRDTAADLGRMLRPYAALPVSPSLAVTCFGPVHHALGVAALTTGDLDAAVLELGSAVARSLALGHLPAAALAGHRLAQALRSRGRPADVSMARDVAAESAARAERIGMALPDPREPVAGRGRQPASAAGPICASGPDRAGVGIVRCGRRWSVTTPVAEAEVDDCVGLRYLAVLVSRPGTEVSALELASATDPAGWADRYSDTPHEVVDRRTLTLYRHRLAELDEQIAEHEAAGDDRAQQCRTEREWIRAELRRVVGVGGRPRCFVTDAERARVSVTKAIARALARIALVDAAVADHLRARVRTGVRCTFTESGVTAVPPVSPAPARWAG